MAKTENVGMVADGSIPSQFTFPGGFHIPTDIVNRKYFDGVAAQLGMSVKGLAYCIQYGLSQSGQDCVAGLAKKLDEATNEDGSPKYDATEKAVAMHDAYKARFDAILAGDIGHRASGPRVKGLEKVMQEVAWEIIVAAAQAKGLAAKLPKKVADQLPMVTKLLASRGDSIKEEAERRMAAASGDLGDLLEGL